MRRRWAVVLAAELAMCFGGDYGPTGRRRGTYLQTLILRGSAGVEMRDGPMEIEGMRQMVSRPVMLSTMTAARGFGRVFSPGFCQFSTSAARATDFTHAVSEIYHCRKMMSCLQTALTSSSTRVIRRLDIQGGLMDYKLTLRKGDRRRRSGSGHCAEIGSARGHNNSPDRTTW